MLVSCRYCNGLHKRGETCPSKPMSQKSTTDIDRFRWSKAWQKKRKEINERDKYLCKVCLAEGRYNYTDLSVHHIIPIGENWHKRLSNNNLITLCRDHHEEAETGTIKRKYLFELIKEE